MFQLRWVGDEYHYAPGYPQADVEVEDLDEALRLEQTELFEIVEGQVPDHAPDAPSAAGQE